MARVDVRTQLDMLDTGVWYGAVTSYSSQHITITAGLESGTYFGSFTYDYYGNVFGRLTGYETRYSGNLEVRVSGLNLDAYWVMRQLDWGDAEAIYEVGLSGADLFFGAAAADAMRGYAGNDQLFGGGGNDYLLGDFGNDRLQGDGGNDWLDGGADIDTAVYAGTLAARVDLALTGQQNTGHGLDRLVGIENVISGSGADVLRGNAVANTLIGQAGNDQLFGAAGNDRLQGDAGNDRLDGGLGIDAAVYAGTIVATVNLALATAQNTGHGWDTLIGIENVVAGSGADVLRGNALANTLVGNAGNDQLFGAAGNDNLQGGDGLDRLDGGAGNDRLIGGTGADRFVFARGYGTDAIADFENGVDKIVIAGGARFADLTIADSGAHVTIRFADGAIVLENIDHRLIEATDFIFV